MDVDFARDGPRSVEDLLRQCAAVAAALRYFWTSFCEVYMLPLGNCSFELNFFCVVSLWAVDIFFLNTSRFLRI